MAKPLSISFPVLTTPQYLRDKGCGERLILIQMAPIDDVRPGVVATRCKCIGVDGNGRMWEHTITLTEWEYLRRNPVVFFETVGLAPIASVMYKKTKSLIQE